MLALAALAALAAVDARAALLAMPFRSPVAVAPATVLCAPAPAPVVALDLGSFYRAGDTSYSQVDPARREARAALTAPVAAFTAGLSRMANAYVASGGRDGRSGACVRRWLAEWARGVGGAGAMTRMANHEAQFLRTVHLSAWAIDYAQVRGLRPADAAEDRAILAWFDAMAADLRRHYDGLANTTARNNHRAWAGLAAMAVAADTGDRSAMRWALRSAAIELDQVTPDGALPLELARQARAAHYHLYAAAPLVMIAEIAAANGQDLYGYRGGALHRLVRFSLNAIEAPATIAAMADAPQKPFVNPRGGYDTQNVAWAEFYARRFPGRAAAFASVFAHRPLANPEIGGDLTMLAAAGRARR